MNQLVYVRQYVFPEISGKTSVIETNHLLYGKNVGTNYDDTFQRITKTNLCDQLTASQLKFFSADQCAIYLSGVLTEGLFATLIYLQDKIIIDMDSMYYWNTTYYYTNKTKYKELTIKQANQQDTLEFLFLFPTLVQPFIQDLLVVFCNSMTQYIDNEQTTQFYILIAFLCCVFVFQVLCSLVVYIENKQVAQPKSNRER
ncbi:MAG: hypothetical protein P4M11_02115 [Candidatus Pacebacteria bacterium]|nr:hypothetical protein [Candidatus Paceibacterota bacterium]